MYDDVRGDTMDELLRDASGLQSRIREAERDLKAMAMGAAVTVSVSLPDSERNPFGNPYIFTPSEGEANEFRGKVAAERRESVTDCQEKLKAVIARMAEKVSGK